MNKLADQPAFPQAYLRDFYDDGRPRTEVLSSEGMTLRQHYAGLAMQGIVSNDNMLRSCTVTAGKGPGGSAETPKYVSLVAIAYADALLAALQQEPKP